MKLIVELLGDLMQLRNPAKSPDLVTFAMRLAQWVFLLIVSLTVTGVLLAFVTH